MKIEPPYKPKYGDNFDANYCNNTEKIGILTRERYEHYLRDEKYKQVFKDFIYINHAELIGNNQKQGNKNKKTLETEKENENNRDKNFINPHLNISNFIGDNINNSTNNVNISFNMSKKHGITNKNENLSYSQNNELFIKSPFNILNNSKMNLVIDLKKRSDETTLKIENEFMRIKKQSNSATTQNLLRQYRQSISQNSTNISSTFYLKKHGSSTTNN